MSYTHAQNISFIAEKVSFFIKMAGIE